MATKATSGKSNGAAGTRPASSIGRPTAGGSNPGARTTVEKMPGPAKSTQPKPTPVYNAVSGGSPKGSASNRISAAPKAQKNGTFQKASGKKPAVQPMARANTPDRIANRMATIQSKKGGR